MNQLQNVKDIMQSRGKMQLYQIRFMLFSTSRFLMKHETQKSELQS